MNITSASDLISRCLPIPGSTDHSVWGLSTHSICTQTDANILKDGFRSFPSGHAGLSFAGLGFLSFYLAGKLHLWDQRGYTARSWLSLVPLLGAALVAVSRTMDYRHHWEDVVVGSLLGLTYSFFSYRQFFPPLAHPSSEVTHAPRIDLSPLSMGMQEETQRLLRLDEEGG
ncbi:PAP2-domain-containing protein [Ramaria rubella]|nr:PAP2-domain-containing protein [Ramaria rubella]